MSFAKAGCDVAVRTECVRDPTNDDGATEAVPMAITRGQRGHEWLHVQATSHLICDLDFVAYNPTWTVHRFEGLRLSPCGADSAFLAEQLRCGEDALLDVSYCRMQTDDFGELPVTVRESHLQWKNNMVHLHVTLNVTATKDKFMKLQQHRLHQQQQGQAALALELTSPARKIDTQRCAMELPGTCFGVGNTGGPRAGAFDVPAPLPAEAAAMLQLRLQSMDDLLYAIKAAAVLLFTALLWALYQMQKPRPKLFSQQRSSPQRSASHPQLARSTVHHSSNDDTASKHYTLPPVSPDSAPIPDKTEVCDYLFAKGDAASASICDRLTQDWTQSRQPRVDYEPKRILKPIPSKRNPFAGTWIRASVGPRPNPPVGGDPPRGKQDTSGHREDDVVSKDVTGDDSSSDREANHSLPKSTEKTTSALASDGDDQIA